MKQGILISICLLCFACLQAQPEKSKVKSSKDPWRFGVKANLSYDNTTLKSVSDYKLGYKVGMIAEKHLVYNLHFQPSVSFAQKGFEIEILNNFKRDVDALLAEVDLGLLLKFGDERLGRGVFLSIAPYFTYGFGGKTKETVLNPIKEDYNVEKEIQTFEYCNRSDLGFKLGIGYDFSKHWEVAVNYTFGMNKIVNTDNYKWKAWNLQLVYFF